MTDKLQAVVRALVGAWRDGRPADAVPLAQALASESDAYAVQDLVAREMGWGSDGGVSYWKSGGSSLAGPFTHARLPARGVWNSPAAAGSWPCTQRWIEAEIALRLCRSVDAQSARDIGASDAAHWIDAMTVSIEWVDSRWQQGLEAPPLLKLADLQSHHALVLGAWVPYEPRDWPAQACTVRIGGQEATHWRGTHALGAPEAVLGPWLRHATRDGALVPAGSVVTTGTWVGALAASQGDVVEVAFEGVCAASLQL